MSTKTLLTNMIALVAEGNEQKAKQVFHSYTQLKMRQVIEATTGKNSRFTDEDTRKLAAVMSVGNAKSVVKAMIDKSASKKEKKEQLQAQLDRCSTVAQCQRLGYNILLSGEGKGVIKEGAADEQVCRECVEKLDQIDPSLSNEDIIKAIIDVAAETPEITVAHINDLLDQIEGSSGEEAIELAKQMFLDAMIGEDQASDEVEDEQMCSESEHELDMDVDDEADDLDGVDQITGDEIDDEEFEELDLPESVQAALDQIDDEEARQIVEDAVIEFFESGMDQGELADQVDDFDHLVTGVMTRCEDECDPEMIECVSAGLDAVKLAMFGDEECDSCDHEDEMDGVDGDDQDDEFDQEPSQDRKFGDLVSAKRVGASEM